VNTARGELIDEEALADAIERGHVGGAALDVFEVEPPVDSRLTKLPQVVATPHIAASTIEAQELVGLETAMAVRDFLRDGVIRNAVNFPAIPDSEFARVRPFMVLAERMGNLLAQTALGRMHGVSIRYYGPLVSAHADLLASAVVAGVLRPMLFESVTVVNARAVAAERGIEIVESRSSRVRDYANMLSVKLQTAGGERWIEGTVFEGSSPRLTLLDGVEVEAPLGGTLILIANNDQPPRHQHRELCARPQRERRGRGRQDRFGRRRPHPRHRSPARRDGDQGSEAGYLRTSRRVAPVSRSFSSTASAPIATTR
jgi:D-3-phosphoglycerate dehydrogenase